MTWKMDDSTLGDDEKGFQKLANDRAKANGTYTGVAKKEPIEMNSLQKGLAAFLGKDKGVSMDVSSPTAPDVKAKGMTYSQRFADGGEVQDPMMTDPLLNGGVMMPSGPAMPPAPPPVTANDAIHTMNTAGPAKNPILDLSSKLAATPDTPPSIYQGISADDRLALQKQLMDQMRSPGQIIAQGAAGLGDAISNSFGGKNTHFQQDIMANNQKQMDNQLSGIDTARAQRLQDIQGNQEAMLNDPASALSQSMAKTLKSAGLNIPTGMSGKVMLQIAGPLGELAMKQATLGIQQQQVSATRENAEASRREEAAKALGERPWYQKAVELVPGFQSDSTKELKSELHPQTSARVAAPSGMVATAHPQDSQAVQWAKANPNDPRAAKILALNGH